MLSNRFIIRIISCSNLPLIASKIKINKEGAIYTEIRILRYKDIQGVPKVVPSCEQDIIRFFYYWP